MKAKTKLFSLILLFLLILCSLTSVYGEDMNNMAADVNGHSNLTENIIEEITTESELNNDKSNPDELNLDESSLVEPISKENIRKSNLNLNSNEETKTFIDLFSEIGPYLDHLTLTNDYAYDSERDQALSMILIQADNFILDGQGHAIDGNGSSCIFLIASNNVTLKNINFINGNANPDYAFVHFIGNGTVDNCTFANNHGPQTGVLSFRSAGTLIDSNFYNNTASSYTIVNFASDGLINNCYFSNNNANEVTLSIQSGGTVNNCKFENNYANNGGAIFGSTLSSQKGLNIKSCQFLNNSAELGGAIYSSYGTTLIDSCEFTLNHANNGGAVYGSYGMIIKDSNFTSNNAEGNGGGNICHHIWGII